MGGSLFKVGTIGTPLDSGHALDTGTLLDTRRTPSKWGGEDQEFSRIYRMPKRLMLKDPLTRKQCLQTISLNKTLARNLHRAKVDTAGIFYICRDLSSVIRLVNKFVVIYFKLLPSANKGVETC